MWFQMTPWDRRRCQSDTEEQYNVKIINGTTTTTMTLGWVVQGLNIVHFQAFLHLG